MKRFYYVTGTLESAWRISEDLTGLGIGSGRIHVMGRDAGSLLRAHLHRTTLWEETDILHYGFLGALCGTLIGVMAGFMLAGMDPWGVDLHLDMVIITTPFGLCLGAWFGGLYGFSLGNHHLRPYLRDVAKGDLLVMVEVDDAIQARRLTGMMRECHEEARDVGHEDHYSPFIG